MSRKTPDKHPVITVITVAYNAGSTISTAIRSVLNQSYPHLQYIVIDGGSTDNTLDEIEPFRDGIDRFISAKDDGIYHAMNKGLQMAEGRIIGFLNADDYYAETDSLKKVAERYSSPSGPQVICGHIRKRKDIDGKPYYKEEKPQIDRLEETMSVFHPATFVAKEVYDEIGFYDTGYQLSADYDFLLKARMKGYRFEELQEVLTVFRTGGRTSMNCTSYQEGYEILKKQGLPHQEKMKKLISRCKRKKILIKIINTLAQLPGFRTLYKRKLIQKWKS